MIATMMVIKNVTDHETFPVFSNLASHLRLKLFIIERLCMENILCNKKLYWYQISDKGMVTFKCRRGMFY